MENNTIELALLEPEERELVQFIMDAIPAEERGSLTADDILAVLDLMDDYLEEQGYMPLTIDELFAKDGVTLEPNTVYYRCRDGITTIRKDSN